ncbi:MAG: hypothetical protein QXP04_02410 [Candidatus Nanoarchaeia archaeon]|nr:hypothetical protein [Candidatus Jingweiarchaeum tengchongense]
MSENVKVYFRNYGVLFFATIVPISSLPYRPPRQYYGNVPDEITGAEPVFLCNRALADVQKCLEIQGLDQYDYITPATVHGPWKAQPHQGIIYTKKLYNITRAANPYKPFPSSFEINELFEKLLKVTYCENMKYCNSCGRVVYRKFAIGLCPECGDDAINLI